MSPMMNPLLIVLCVGIVYCEETDKAVTVTSITTVTPTTGNSTSRVVIENKVQNLTVEYNSDHGRNKTYVVNPLPGNQTTAKPLIITTSKEIRLIQTPPLNDSIATANTISKTNSPLLNTNKIKHHGRVTHKKDHPNHFLPTIKPEFPTKFANLSKYASHTENVNLTKALTSKGTSSPTKNQTNFPNGQSGNIHQNPQFKHPVQRHVQNAKPQQYHYHRPTKTNLSHATEIEMEKVEVKEMRYVEMPKDNKKFRYYMAADENTGENKPSTSSQMFEMAFFNSKHSHRNPNSELKQMDKYKVSSKPYYNTNQDYRNAAKTSTYTTAPPLQYMTPPHPTIYTVRPKIPDVNDILITTAAPLHKNNESNQLSVKVHPHSARDFSCLRCFGSNKPPKTYKYPTYANKNDPILEGSRAVKLLGPDGDNFLGGSKHHFVVVAKPDAPRKSNATSYQNGQGAKRPETPRNQGKQYLTPKRPEAVTTTGKPNMPPKRPEILSAKPQAPPSKSRTPFTLKDDGSGSFASSTLKRPEIFSVTQKSMAQMDNQKGNFSTRIIGLPQVMKNSYIKDGSYASSNVEFSVSRPNFKATPSPFKLDPSSDMYNFDEELQASATSMRKHHPNVQVETKEIHIPIPEIIETRVPYPIHIKVDRPVPVHIDKPYPVHVEKKVPVPVKINVPQPYPVEKEVPYPVKIPIEVPRPVQVVKPVPYLVENPMPIQVFKHVKVPVKVPVDVPVPYKVHVEVEKRVPFFVEKKVPFEVPVPVEKPYLVEVKKPFEVPQEKPEPVTVEKKIPVPVQVVEFVKVPVHSPHDQHNFHHMQHRFGEASDHNEHMASSQSTKIAEIPIEQNQRISETQPASDQSPSPSNQQSTKMKVVLPHMISVEFPADYDHRPTGPASGFLPTARDVQT